MTWQKQATLLHPWKGQPLNQTGVSLTIMQTLLKQWYSCCPQWSIVLQTMETKMTCVFGSLSTYSKYHAFSKQLTCERSCTFHREDNFQTLTSSFLLYMSQLFFVFREWNICIIILPSLPSLSFITGMVCRNE